MPDSKFKLYSHAEARAALGEAANTATRRLRAAIHSSFVANDVARIHQVLADWRASAERCEERSEDLTWTVEVGKRELLHFAQAAIESDQRIRARFGRSRPGPA